MSDFDVIVIGGGPGGYVAAIRASQLGLRTAIVEKREALGGTCLNVGCIPSKALLDTSEFFARARDEAGDHGISLGEPSIDVAKMMKRKAAVVRKLTGGVGSLMKLNKVEVYTGVGRLTDPHTVEVAAGGQRDNGAGAAAGAGGDNASGGDNATGNGATQTLTGKHIILATGSAPIELPFLPFDGETVVDSTGALDFEEVPEELVVVGGGVIGLELGSVWARLGAKVTVVEVLPQIMNGWDSQTAKVMKRELSKQGITFHLETKVTGIEAAGAAGGETGAGTPAGETGGAGADAKKAAGTKGAAASAKSAASAKAASTDAPRKVTITATGKDGRKLEISADKVLVAVGRKPYTEGVGLETAGVETDEKGRVRTDAHGATTAEGVWAVGDIVAGPMLAHKAEDEGMAVAERIAGKAGHVNYETIPNVIYTWPEAASVGKTEDQLKEEGVAYKVGTFPFSVNGRALAMEATSGSVRILADEKSDRVLGAHIVGPWASDLITEIVTVMEFGGCAEDIARTVHAHPTLSEVVREAALGVDGRMIHAKN